MRFIVTDNSCAPALVLCLGFVFLFLGWREDSLRMHGLVDVGAYSCHVVYFDDTVGLWIFCRKI